MLLANPVIRRQFSIAATVVITILVLWLTLTPRDLPHSDVIPLDKVAHAVAFALMVLPTAWGYPRALAVTIPMALVLGGAIELLQPMVGRGREMADFVMDVVGIGAGLVIGLFLRRFRT